MTSSYGPGEIVPNCYGMMVPVVFYAFQAQAGRPFILVAAHAVQAPGLLPLVRELTQQREFLASKGADIVVVVRQDYESMAAQDLSGFAGVTLLACYDPGFFPAMALAPGQTTTLVVDRSLRIVERFDQINQDVAPSAIAAIAALPIEAPQDVFMPAPVLMIHHLLDRNFCRRLITRFEEGGNFDSGMASVDAAGAASYKIDHGKKRRRDHLLEPGEALHDEVHAVLMRRCSAEIKKVFHIDIAHIDRLIIARYDDDGGHFAKHRDNAAPGVAFRQFALSVNLNAGEFEGGTLNFPEYNNHRYCLPTGAGMIFSSSLLHQVSPVTKGSRYALLTFLHDEAAEQRRLAGA
jgi:predicted 2-oxoglutarate/Fe(II)-dependent dioxygenase YbiX